MADPTVVVAGVLTQKPRLLHTTAESDRPKRTEYRPKTKLFVAGTYDFHGVRGEKTKQLTCSDCRCAMSIGMRARSCSTEN